jgi:hypothetical protein
MPRKAGRSRKKRGGASFFILLFVVLLVAGFLASRLMRPAEPRYVTSLRHPYPAPGIAPEADAVARNPAQAPPGIAPYGDSNPQFNHGASGENLTPDDHRALDELIRRKSH